MLFNRLIVFLGGVTLFALGLLLFVTAWNKEFSAEMIKWFLTTNKVLPPSNACWYGTLGVLLMMAPLLYLWNLWANWRHRRFWQLLMGPNIISVDLKPLERALRNQMEVEEDIEAAKMRLVIPEFGRNRLVGILSLTIAEQPNLNHRVDELRKRLVDQVRLMLPELKLDVHVRLRLATRLDARLFNTAAVPAPAATGNNL